MLLLQAPAAYTAVFVVVQHVLGLRFSLIGAVLAIMLMPVFTIGILCLGVISPRGPGLVQPVLMGASLSLMVLVACTAITQQKYLAIYFGLHLLISAIVGALVLLLPPHEPRPLFYFFAGVLITIGLVVSHATEVDTSSETSTTAPP